MRKFMLLATMVMVLGVVSALGDTLDDDPLHGFCWGGPACTDNGTNTPTSTNPPNFGFWISPGPQTGNYFIDILVPTSAGIQPGFSITGDLSGTASLFSTTPWSSGDLDTYLGTSASPTNPIGAYAAGGTSFYVYQANLGNTTLGKDAATSPDLTIAGGIPLDSYIVGFLTVTTCTTDKKTGKETCTTNDVATANSGALWETGHPPTPPTTVPEPGSLMLFGTGLLSVAGYMRRKLLS
jgi:PEP-CTERM motif